MGINLKLRRDPCIQKIKLFVDKNQEVFVFGFLPVNSSINIPNQIGKCAGHIFPQVND